MNEKPPLFCFYCGKVSHGVKDCDDFRDEEDPQLCYGGWLKASPWKHSRAKDFEGIIRQGCYESEQRDVIESEVLDKSV